MRKSSIWFHIWCFKLLHRLVRQDLTADNFEIIWNLDKILVCIMRYNICNYPLKKFPLENYFEAVGFQTFDAGLLLLALQGNTEKIVEALAIILFQFLTLSCKVVAKGHTCLMDDIRTQFFTW